MLVNLGIKPFQSARKQVSNVNASPLCCCTVPCFQTVFRAPGLIPGTAPGRTPLQSARMKQLSNLTIGIAMLAAAFAPAHCATLGGPLTLEDEGAFFVGGKTVTSNFPGASLLTGPSAPGRITVNQMYVHYRIPAGKHGAPVVMVHGSNHTGMSYETTPDGREGWATYFVRRGAPVYVVDHAGRGRSGSTRRRSTRRATRAARISPRSPPCSSPRTRARGSASASALPGRCRFPVCNFRSRRWSSTRCSSCRTRRPRSRESARTR